MIYTYIIHYIKCVRKGGAIPTVFPSGPFFIHWREGTGFPEILQDTDIISPGFNRTSDWLRITTGCSGDNKHHTIKL